ncbi:MAG: PAS domain S-box protein [Planctomycetota bacterium]
MQSPLRILHLEDSPNDAELIQERLASDGVIFEAVTVATKAEYLAALERGGHDIVLCDCSIPGFDGLSAFKAAQEHCPDVPVVFVTGTIGENLAVELLRAGGRDYLLKDHLARLASAVLGALREAAEHRKRQQTEQSLRDSEARYRRLFEAAKDGILILDAETGTILDVNPFLTELLRFSREAFIGKKIWEMGFVKDIVTNEASLAELQQKEYVRYEDISLETGDGRRIEVEFVSNVYLVNQRKVIQCSIRDITERKRAKEALRGSEAEFRAMFEMASIGMGQADPHTGQLLRVNQKMCAITGYSADELLKMRIAELTHPADRQKDWDAFQRVVRGEAPDYRMEKRYTRKDGTVAWVNVNMTVIRDAAGQPVRTMATIEDITERKRTEESLTRLAMAVEQAAEAVVITDANATILYVNPAFEKISGYTRAEALGQNPRILKSGKQDAEFYRRMWDTLGRGVVWHGRLINKKKDGTLYEENVTISPVRDTTGRIVNYISLQLDVTHEAQLETQLRQALKMEAVGRLAGGMAHDFNNILSVVLGYSLMALGEMAADDPLRKKLEAVVRAGERGAALTRQLLIFSRKQVVQPKVLGLNPLVTDFEKMLRRLIGEDIKVTLALAPDAGHIRADPGHIEQVIMNLCVNARDAMPKGGKLLIETANVTLDEAYARVHPDVGPGLHVMLAVSDTGSGMSSEVLSHLFEPFFTTKELGKGTGLGLSVVYGIVKQSGGSIAVYSEVGQGTTFKVYLPRVDPAAPTSGPRAAVAVVEARGETVLVVDDDKDIRNMVQETLQHLGYKVLVGAGSQHALRLAEGHTGPLHLLVTDVVMPDLSGKELAERVLAKHPQVKVLFMSGYTDNVMLNHGVNWEKLSFIEKPFTPTTLARKVREVLGV